MNQLKKIYVCVALSILMIANFSIGLFFLPALPAIGASFGAPKYDSQLAYPLILFGSFITYVFLGALSDSFGAKKVLCCQLILFLMSFLICLFSQSMTVFLLGIFMQGVSSYYTLIIRYCKVQLDFNVVQLLSILSITGTIFIPINAMISGHLAHYNWRYIFALWSAISILCLVLTIFLPTKPSVKYIKFYLAEYLKNLSFFIRNSSFHESFLCIVSVEAVLAIFYTLSPHIFITDFSLSPKVYASYLFIPTAGMLLGYSITSPLKKLLGDQGCILAGEIVALTGILSFVVLFYFFPTPMLFMTALGFFMVSIPLISANIYMQVMVINATLAGSALSLLSIGLNVFNGVVGISAAQQDGEQMGVFMLIILTVGFGSYNFLKRRNKFRE